MNKLFPIFLKAEELQFLVVGGGNVGLEKLQAILHNAPGAHIRLVAPMVKPEILDLQKKHPHVCIEQRNFQDSDLNGKHLVICATDNPELHKAICRMARERCLLVNVADTPELCDAYLASIVQKGDLKIAISTNGKSPTFAKRLKEVLDETLVETDINLLLKELSKYRDSLKGNFSEKVRALYELTKILK